MNEEKKVGRKKTKPTALERYKSVFATTFRDLIKEKKCTHEMIAEEVGTTRQTIGKWTNGDSAPDIISAAKIADYFGISTDYLLGRSGGVRSVNPDVQRVEAYTGLSESAIQALNSNIVNGRFRIGGHTGLVLSSLLSSEETYFLLDHIYEYIHLLDCSNAIKWLISFFIKESWHGLFNDIDDNETAKIIATVKKFVAYTTTYTVRETLNDSTLNDGDDIASYFEWVKKTFDEDTRFLSYNLSEHFKERISSFSKPIPINAIVDEFKEALEICELSPATIERVISRMNEELPKKAGD